MEPSLRENTELCCLGFSPNLAKRKRQEMMDIFVKKTIVDGFKSTANGMEGNKSK
jgi:hypothetical protein